MLKTSPMPSTSANSSPAVASFHHASSSNIYATDPTTAPLSSTLRRSSSKSAGSSAAISVTSPVSSRLVGHASMDSLSISGRRRSSLHNDPAQPPPSPRSQTMAKSTTAASPPAKANPQPAPQEQQPASSSAAASVALSPVKRRSSISPKREARPPVQPSAAPTASTDSSASLKRAKPQEQPPTVLPKKYEFCPVDHMVELIAQMLAELITTNDAIQLSSNGALTRFHSRTPPGISVRDYLQRLARHATLPPPLLLVMVYYIDRLCAMYPEFTINTLTVHRFLITAATVAAKGLSDSFWNNTTYARVGGVRLAELKLLELEFLHRVDWKIIPNPEVLESYYRALVDRTPGYALESSGSSEGSLDDDGDDDDDERDGEKSDSGIDETEA